MSDLSCLASSVVQSVALFLNLTRYGIWHGGDIPNHPRISLVSNFPWSEHDEGNDPLPRIFVDVDEGVPPMLNRVQIFLIIGV